MKINPNIQEIALRIANRHYPDAECVMLTGSQVEPDFVTAQSDIDILLIGSQFNHISSDGMLEEGYKVDFTRLGYTDLANLLIDVSYCTVPIFLNMIRSGVILKDDTGIGKLAKAYADDIFQRGNLDAGNDIRSLTAGLAKLKKHFLQNLNDKYDLFLLGDFLRLISSAYLFLNNKGWSANDGFRQVKTILLNDRNSSVLDNLVRLGHDFVKKPKDNVQLILTYIDQYLNDLTRVGDSIGFDDKLIVNINFRNQSTEAFYRDICGSILDDAYLSKYFLRGQIHNFRHIFKNSYVLIFDKHAEEYDEIRLLKELDMLFFRQRRRVLDLRIVNPAYLTAFCGDGNIREKQDGLLATINRRVIGVIGREAHFNPRKIFLLGVIFSALIIRAFGISREEVQAFLGLLIRKWLPMNYFATVKERCLSDTAAFEKNYAEVYAKNQTVYEQVRAHFIDSREMTDDTTDFAAVVADAEALAGAVAESDATLPELALRSLKLDATPIRKPVLWHLGCTLEAMLNTIGVEPRERSYLAYVIKALYR